MVHSGGAAVKICPDIRSFSWTGDPSTRIASTAGLPAGRSISAKEPPVVQSVRIGLDRSSPIPLYHQVSTAIEAAIDSGELVSGEFLENEVAMAARLGISRQTTRQALQELVDRGQLVRRRGVGTQVAPSRIRRPVKLSSLFDDLAASGRRPSTTVLSYKVDPAADDVAASLGLDPGTVVAHIERLRRADDEPLAIMTNYVPVASAPTEEELGATGLYDALRARGIRPWVANQAIGARLATAAEARLLNEHSRAALLTMERVAFDDTGGPIELGRHVYRASRYSFETQLFAR